MEKEINQVLTEINNIEQQLKNASKDRPENDVDGAIFDDELIQLETKLEMCRNRLLDLYQVRDYQAQCNHVFVDDLIDISPDKSMVIRYCIHCEYSDSQSSDHTDR